MISGMFNPRAKSLLWGLIKNGGMACLGSISDAARTAATRHNVTAGGPNTPSMASLRIYLLKYVICLGRFLFIQDRHSHGTSVR